MDNIQKAELNKANRAKAAALGVVVEIVNNAASINPLRESLLIWVGLDRIMPTHYGYDFQIQQVVQRYIKENEKDFSSEDPNFFWRGIEKTTDADGIDFYTLASEEDEDLERIHSEFSGFVYGRPTFLSKSDTAKNKILMMDTFAEQLNNYNEWLKGSYLRVRSQSGKYMARGKLSENINKDAELLLAEYSELISSNTESLTMTVQLDSTPDYGHIDDAHDSARAANAALQAILPEISRNSVLIACGESLYNGHNNQVSFGFLPDKMPSLADIIEEKGTDFLRVLKANYRHVVSVTGMQEQSGWELLKTVLTKVPFENMPKLLQITAYYALLEDTKGFEMLKITSNN